MLDYCIYRDCFSSADMRSIWSEHTVISAWLRVEQVLAEHQAMAGLIPAEAARAINALSICDLKKTELQTEMMLVGRPIVGLVKQLRALVPEHAVHVHFQATTQDVMDTATALQMKLGLELVENALNRIVTAIDHLASSHPDTIMMGRTNGQHAVPIQLSTKLAVWRSELERRSRALNEAAARGLNVQIGGPVGDLRGYKNGEGQQIKLGIAASLGLNVVDPHWQNARDGMADIITALGTLCGTLCKIAHNVNQLSSSDINEFLEVYESGKGASSAMAHKRNQRASEFGEAVARLGRQRAEQIGELTLHEHERSGGVWIGEWVVVPETFLLTSGALKWSERMLKNLVFNTDAMNKSLAADFMNKPQAHH
ncbi:3-carboxy-cis,cis-muconate cycloisomerase [Ruegeria denitrificans]|uniref:3-carboxy-cis,cis-muconate cycloisomerase n=1 Tax=Ruegeria denitrificans TaxID=1715692 RepID=A0A0N7M9C8_9RHOB|nr:lyase family protein [Ruegeria denitrificans]CUJ97875.1 3-carboxy-cis,cis-muconate cycloisomerase [Ruegeria denitrificans]